MTRNQKAKLVARVATFIVVFSLMVVCIPYVAIPLAICFAVKAARQL